MDAFPTSLDGTGPATPNHGISSALPISIRCVYDKYELPFNIYFCIEAKLAQIM